MTAGSVIRVLFVALVLGAADARASVMQHAFLVQNSGWMEPFYTDPDSQLKPLVAALATTAAKPGETISLLAFNQRVEGNPSPALLYQGTDAGEIHAALQPLTVARRPSGALADTDFREAVEATIVEAFERRPGIIWIFTNNRNSPGNDPDTVARNREFYHLIHLAPSITRSLAFPLRMKVRGRHYEASGLMVYALAYGDEAGRHLAALVDQGVLARVFTAQPARLKPLDRDAVRIVPDRVTSSPNIQVALANDQRTLVFDVRAAETATRIGIEARLENLFFPYEIVNAQVRGALLLQGGEALPVKVQPEVISGLAPGALTRVALELPLPAAMVPSPWSMSAIRAMGRQVIVPAAITITLDGQELRVAESFRATVASLFPGDPLSDVFVPPASIDASSVAIPIQLRVQYPLWPLVLGFSILALSVVAGLSLLVLVNRPTRHEIWIDGSKRNVLLKAFNTVDLKDAEGRPVGKIRRRLGRPQVVQVAEGHTVSMSRT